MIRDKGDLKTGDKTQEIIVDNRKSLNKWSQIKTKTISTIYISSRIKS